VLAAHREIRAVLPDARLILVPRHPTRAGEVEALCRDAGFTVARHTEQGAVDRQADVVLVDAMGVLLDYYALASVAFVGGSLAPIGGHNPIEPALCGVPMVTGPHVFNFADVVEPFRVAGCLERIERPAGLAPAVLCWLQDEARRTLAADRARAVVAANAGATARLRALLEAELGRVSSRMV
jgi:3-deoxy-D-manno-octulosonic-acid transferase